MWYYSLCSCSESTNSIENIAEIVFPSGLQLRSIRIVHTHMTQCRLCVFMCVCVCNKVASRASGRASRWAPSDYKTQAAHRAESQVYHLYHIRQTGTHSCHITSAKQTSLPCFLATFSIKSSDNEFLLCWAEFGDLKSNPPVCEQWFAWPPFGC